MSDEPATFYAWLIRHPRGPAALLNARDLSACLVFADLARALEAREEALALAEQTGHPVDLAVLTIHSQLFHIDPREWTDEPAAEEPTA